MKTSNEADAKFQKAVETLSDYERNSHRKNPVSKRGRVKTVEERMQEATVNDKSSSTILNRLKEEAVHVREVLTPLLCHNLIPISSYSRKRRRQSSFICTSPFLIRVLPS